MTLRIRFCKYGILKFIGHLDVMRYFQKAVRRAGFDVAYSRGYSPHQLMSFASPLGVGLTSDAEYLDVELHSCDSPEIMTERLNAVMAEGIRVSACRILPETPPNTRRENAMSAVAAADYLVSLKDGYQTGLENQEWKDKFRDFMAAKTISVLKKSKSGDKETDIRPMIYEYAFPGSDAYPDSCMERYQNGLTVFLRTAAGSTQNLKPELVIEAFSESAGLSFDRFAWQIHRLQMYRRSALTQRFEALIP